MRQLIYIFLLFFTTSSHAAEKLETLPVGVELPDKILPVILQMDAQHLSDFSSYLQRSFDILEKRDIIKRPFTPTLARIVNYHFRKTVDSSVDVPWDYSFSMGDQTYSLNFCDLLSVYAELQTLFKPAFQYPSGIKTEAPPKTEDIAHYLQSFLPYVNAYRLHYKISPILVGDLFGIAKNTNQVMKISVYFRRFQRSWATIETMTPWNWTEMRYYLERVSNHMSSSFFPIPQPFLFAPPDDFTNLFLGYISDQEYFLETVRKLVKTLQTILSFPIDEHQSSTTFKQKHRKNLKILFNQLEPLNMAEFQKTEDPKYLRVLEFWSLYLKITKNHLIKSSLPSLAQPKYDSSKVTLLCNSLIHGSFNEGEDESELAISMGNYEKNDIEKVLATPDGLECFEAILTSFPNPFTPRLHEILAYQYYINHLTDMLDDAAFPILPSTPSPLAYIPVLNTITRLFSFSKEK